MSERDERPVKVGYISPALKTILSLIFRSRLTNTRFGFGSLRVGIAVLKTHLGASSQILLEYGSVRFVYKRGTPLGLVSARFFEPKSYALICASRGALFVDIGASVGAYVISAARRFERVTAVEPDRESCETLKRNISLNGLSNVTVVTQALSHKAGVAKLSKPIWAVNRSLVDKTGSFDLVETATLDMLLAHESKIDFMKIDVEGAEVSVLTGGAEALRRTDRVIVEIRRENHQKVVRMMASLGFCDRVLEDRGVDKNVLFYRTDARPCV
jgi:FkbM family methyltransferase